MTSAKIRSRLADFYGSCVWNEEPRFYQRLLENMVADARNGGVTAQVLGPLVGHGAKLTYPLLAFWQLAGGAAPGLARYFPTADRAEPRAAEISTAWPEFEQAIRDHPEAFAADHSQMPQSNLPARATALYPAYLHIADRTAGRPIASLEVGASAGLFAAMDRYAYPDEYGGIQGDPDSPVAFHRRTWSGGVPVEHPVRFADRLACDLFPFDIGTPDGLRAFRDSSPLLTQDEVRWFEGGTRLALDHRVRVEQADGVEWLADQLAVDRSDQTTVVMTSALLGLMPPESQTALLDAIAAAGRRATTDAPLFEMHLVRPDGWHRGHGNLLELRLVEHTGGEPKVDRFPIRAESDRVFWLRYAARNTENPWRRNTGLTSGRGLKSVTGRGPDRIAGRRAGSGTAVPARRPTHRDRTMQPRRW